MPDERRAAEMEQQDGARLSTAYLRFAEEEVRDKSPLYCELLRGAASDRQVIAFLLTLPREKRQPNLFLAAARRLFGTPAGWDQLRSHVLQDLQGSRKTKSLTCFPNGTFDQAVSCVVQRSSG